MSPASRPYPLGVSLMPGGANVAVFSSVGVGVDFCLFGGEAEETRTALDSVDGNTWHGFVEGVSPGAEYGIRVDGPYLAASGVRCNHAKLLIDPYARSLAGRLDWSPSWSGYDPADPVEPSSADSAPDMCRSVAVDTSFDWQGDEAPSTPLEQTVIYEVHVKGFTQQHPELSADVVGTYAGLAQPQVVSYLKNLGITAVELMPVHARLNNGQLKAVGLSDYWGYNSIAYFALHAGYSAARRRGGAPGSEIAEFQEMVRVLHAAGIEVLLDMVFNHTGEGNELGPTVSFRGIDNPAYYALVAGAPEYYDNLSGCGNTINAASPAVRRLALDAMRYWVTEMHVDGFRFDLASIMASDLPPRPGNPDPLWDQKAAFFELIEQDPILSGVKLIAEPWAAGEYELGKFPARWSEWNGRFRDATRDFWRAASAGPRAFAASLAGSPDIFFDPEPRLGQRRQPTASINLVTCHDGFTLTDLVSYDGKHNAANLLDPHSGSDDNRSWNCGSDATFDGATNDEGVASLRRRQRFNFLASLVLARGVPMILAGDERGRSQKGNNNAWCQDNEISWMEWTASKEQDELTSLASTLLELRRESPTARVGRFSDAALALTSEPAPHSGMLWYRPDAGAMADADWDASWLHAVAAVLPALAPSDRSLLLLFNSFWEPISFKLPSEPNGGRWKVVLDTASWPGAPAGPAEPATYQVGARATVVLTSWSSAGWAPAADC